MLTDAHFREYMRLLRRCKPWTRKRPPWFLFQMWLRRRPMTHEFLISPIADYLLSVGVSDEAIMQFNIRAWPAWVYEFQDRWQKNDAYRAMPNAAFNKPLGWPSPTVRDCLAALDSMRGWTPKMNLQHGRQ